MRLNPFTAKPQPAETRDGGRIVKPSGKTTIQMPGARRSIHCMEAAWDLQSMGERDRLEAEMARKSGMGRGRGRRRAAPAPQRRAAVNGALQSRTARARSPRLR